MKVLITQSVQSVKRLCSELRPGILDDLGLIPALGWYTEQFENRSGIHCHLHIHPEEFDIDRDLSISIYRILQESLTNVSRHAKAKNIWVSLVQNSETIGLTIEDDGSGIDETAINGAHSFGIIGMRERVISHNGSFDIQHRQGQGTAIKAAFPVKGDAQEAVIGVTND
jgi:signal transduction histidine kinase